jgi:hypothetical protein
LQYIPPKESISIAKMLNCSFKKIKYQVVVMVVALLTTTLIRFDLTNVVERKLRVKKKLLQLFTNAPLARKLQDCPFSLRQIN